MPPQPVRPAVTDERTRLDIRRVYDVADPTIAVRVSPIGTHTVGAAAANQPRPVDTINRLLDERERAQDRRDGRAAAHTARTVREQAAARAAAKLRHEQHLEHLESVRAWIVTVIFFCLLVIVVGAGIVGWGILDGWFTWQLVRSR